MQSMLTLEGGNVNSAMPSHAFSTPPEELCSARRRGPFEPIASAGALHGGLDVELGSVAQRFECEPMRIVGQRACAVACGHSDGHPPLETNFVKYVCRYQSQ